MTRLEEATVAQRGLARPVALGRIGQITTVDHPRLSRPIVQLANRGNGRAERPPPRWSLGP
jgi:hypothetical protein